MPRRNQKPYWLDTALSLRKGGATLKQISNKIDIPISTVRYQLYNSLNPEQYDKYCKEPNSHESKSRTIKILALNEEGLNGNQIAQLVGDAGFENITVHLDINPDDKYISNKFYKEFVNMVKGCGYKCITKPDAFAASIADMFT